MTHSTNETGRIVSSSIPNDYDDRDGVDDGFLTDGESGYILDEELDSDYNWYNTIIGRLLLLFGYSRNDVVNKIILHVLVGFYPLSTRLDLTSLWAVMGSFIYSTISVYMQMGLISGSIMWPM